MHEIVFALIASIGDEIVGPLVWIHKNEVGVRKSVDAAIRVYTHRSAIHEYYRRLGIEDCHQSLQQSLVSVIVGLCDPNVFTMRQPHALIPLLEGASRIHFVELDPHPWLTSVLGENRSAVVGGTIVEQDQFEVLEGLSQDTIYSLRQECSMIVVRNNYAHLWARSNRHSDRENLIMSANCRGDDVKGFFPVPCMLKPHDIGTEQRAPFLCHVQNHIHG